MIHLYDVTFLVIVVFPRYKGMILPTLCYTIILFTCFNKHFIFIGMKLAKKFKCLTDIVFNDSFVP